MGAAAVLGSLTWRCGVSKRDYRALGVRRSPPPPPLSAKALRAAGEQHREGQEEERQDTAQEAVDQACMRLALDQVDTHAHTGMCMCTATRPPASARARAHARAHTHTLARVQARLAYAAGEVPIGAVLVQSSPFSPCSIPAVVVAAGRNEVERRRDPTAHAEVLCLRRAAMRSKSWRLAGHTLYVTVEPCAMCAGAVLNSRVDRLVWGAVNTRHGADGSWVSLFPRDQHDEDGKQAVGGLVHPFVPQVRTRGHVLEDECGALMREFFRSRRKESSNAIRTCESIVVE
eukprot:jgi/Chlat1/1130/Chrsp111S01600